MKKVYVDKDLCIGCALCTQICPNIFEMGDDGKAQCGSDNNHEVSAEEEEKTQQPMDSCPVAAIKWKEE